MALVLADRVRETTTVVGTGTATLLGAVTGYQSFTAVGNANTTYYVIASQAANEWEVGIGTYTASGTTLSRDTVLSSSNAGALVNFTAGTKDIWVDYAAGRAVYENEAGNVDGFPITGGSINNTVIGNTTPNAATFTTLTATGQTSLGGAAGSESLRVVEVASSTEWIAAYGSAGTTVSLRAEGANPNQHIALSSKGSSASASAVRFFTNSMAQEQMRVSHTASAVNFVQVTGAATGAAPTISAQGSDLNIEFNIATKGTGAFNFFTRSTARQFEITNATSSINWLRVNGSATGNGVQLSAQGSDTNISQVFQSKGTGAINLAPGSSGVNISNGGTVTTITRTATNSNYTSAPAVAISAPTTAGGVQATATCTIGMTLFPINGGGTGYTVGDVLTISGGTFTTAAQVQVSTVSGGVITAVSGVSAGVYTVAPTNPASVTGGTGSGATFNCSFAVNTAFTITNAGSGYVEQPTVTFSGGGGSGAAAYATVGSGTTVRSLGANLSLNTPGGEQVRIVDSSSAATNYIALGGGTGNVSMFAAGSSANISQVFSSKGTGSATFQTNTFAQTQFVVAHTASAVNFVQVTGAATGNTPAISAQGSDANVNLLVNPKGTGAFSVFANNGVQFRVTSVASAVNQLQVTGSIAGAAPIIAAVGSDTNIPLVVQPKGTGALQAQLNDGTATGGNARGANAVDWQTSRTAASQVASGFSSNIAGGYINTASGSVSGVLSGTQNNTSAALSVIAGGIGNTTSASASGNTYSFVGSGYTNNATGIFNFIGGGFTNSGTAAAAVTTQSATMNGTTAVTLSGSNASIRVGQYITGTSINGFPPTYVAAISGTSLTLSQAASGSSTSTLSFFTPHGVVVGGGNNQATGSYSFIGGGGDAGTAANRNVASGDWSFVGGGGQNTASGAGSVICGGGYYVGGFNAKTASGIASFIGGGLTATASGQGSAIVCGNGNSASGTYSFIGSGVQNIANGYASFIGAGNYGTARAIVGNHVFPACNAPISTNQGHSQAALLVLGVQTTDATATVLRSDTSAASTTNQVILPNNAAYHFKGSVIANVTGAANGAAWSFEGAIMRGANAASTVLIDTPSINRIAASAGATAWTIAITADTTNGGLAVTVTGAASTTIRWVAKVDTTEVTF